MEVTEKVINHFEQYEKGGGIASDRRLRSDQHIDGLDDETFEKWLSYHFAICERQDLIGASHHTLDILKKR